MAKIDWIPINTVEDLPEESGEYLVYIVDPFVKTYDDEFPFNNLSHVTSAEFFKEDCMWFVNRDVSYNANNSCVNKEKAYYISHWANMPEGPLNDTVTGLRKDTDENKTDS